MPIISGGGGGGGPAAGSYLPVAGPSGVTVDTTTYDNPEAGGKLTTLVFPSLNALLAAAVTGDAHPRWLMGSTAADGLYFGDGAIDLFNVGPALYMTGSNGLTIYAPGTVALSAAVVQVPAPTNATGPPRMSSVSPRFTITSGALPTVTLSSGTGAQISTTRDAETVTPFTGDGTNNAATLAVALSPDDLTYSTLDTLSIAAAVNLTGVLVLSAGVRVPAGWYIKLTAVHGTIGTTTYY